MTEAKNGCWTKAENVSQKSMIINCNFILPYKSHAKRNRLFCQHLLMPHITKPSTIYLTVLSSVKWSSFLLKLTTKYITIVQYLATPAAHRQMHLLQKRPRQASRYIKSRSWHYEQIFKIHYVTRVSHFCAILVFWKIWEMGFRIFVQLNATSFTYFTKNK